MARDGYRQQRTCYQDVSGALAVGTGTTTTTLVTNVRAGDAIFVQKIHIEVTVTAAQNWTFQDSNGTPLVIAPSFSTSAIAHFDIDFGPVGVPLTIGKDFVLSISAAGAAGVVTWEAYQRQNKTISA